MKEIAILTLNLTFQISDGRMVLDIQLRIACKYDRLCICTLADAILDSSL